MITLEEALIRNYNELSFPEGLPLVVAYIKRTSTFLGESFDFIKAITKVANNIIDSDDSLRGLEERLYGYCLAGIRKGEKSVNVSVNGLAHLYAHAGSFARIIFETRNEIVWAERWYETKQKSADMTIESDLKHAARTYGFAADAAEALFNIFKPRDYQRAIFWAERCYESYRKSADITVESEPKHSAHAYSFAGNIAEALAIIFKSRNTQKAIFWAERWYESYRKSADITVESEPKHSAHAYSFTGNAAYFIYKRNRESKWKDFAIECYTKFVDYFRSNPYEGIVKPLKTIEDRLEELTQPTPDARPFNPIRTGKDKKK